MILRGEKISGEVLISANRELVTLRIGEQKMHSLFEQEYQKAFEKGKSQGYKEGKRESQEALSHLHALMQKVAHRLLEHKQQLLHQLKPEIIEFALAAAFAVLKRELKEKETLIELIHHLLNKVSHYESSEKWHLFLSPQDFVKLEEGLGYLAPSFQSKGGISIHPDPTLLNGDFRIESEKTLLKFSLEREMQQIKQEVLETATHA
jgi:flagellar biosynthesis/type III secretory pathway protein FliH